MATAMQRVRAFAGQPTSVRVSPCRTRVLRQTTHVFAQKSALEGSDQVATTAPSLGVPIALSIALGSLGLASRAIAEEPAISPDDAAVLAASGTGSSIDEIIVSLLFGTVVLLLVIVTGGVAYINIKQWLDGRQEKEDRERDGKAPAAAAGSAAARADADGEDGEDGDVVVPLKRASRIKKEKGKGFASSEFTSRR